MHRVTLDPQGGLVLPEDVRRRYAPDRGQDFLLGKTESGLALYPLRPDVRKVYLSGSFAKSLEYESCGRHRNRLAS